MSNFRICVYAIAKNEEKFAARWAENMSEADEIVVLDTGSEDKTVEILSAFPKVSVFSEKISPWRFDTARNKSLEMVSEDIDFCVCTDLDEVFNAGWRENLERALEKSPDLVNYRYTWDFNEDKSEKTVFNIEKIHRRHGFLWTHPVHEVLTPENGGEVRRVFADGVHLMHFPDSSKSRSQYLPLLMLSVEENPEDDRNVHYLGREFMFYRRWDEAITTLKRHLSMASSRWSDERCASMRYIARCLINQNKPSEALLWYLKACAEASHLREPFVEAAQLLYSQKNWHGVIFFCQKALEITHRTNTYITDSAVWEALPYDLLAIAFYHTGDIKAAISNTEIALTYSLSDERLQNNLLYYKTLI